MITLDVSKKCLHLLFLLKRYKETRLYDEDAGITDKLHHSLQGFLL
jgi:hypothetical protein